MPDYRDGYRHDSDPAAVEAAAARLAVENAASAELRAENPTMSDALHSLAEDVIAEEIGPDDVSSLRRPKGANRDATAREIELARLMGRSIESVMREDPLAFATDEEIDRLVADARRVADYLREQDAKHLANFRRRRNVGGYSQMDPRSRQSPSYE